MDGEDDDSEAEDPPSHKPVVVVKKASKPRLLVSNSPLYSLSSLSSTASPSVLRPSFSSLSSFSAFNAKRDVKTKRFVPRPESAIIPAKKSVIPIQPAVQAQECTEDDAVGGHVEKEQSVVERTKKTSERTTKKTTKKAAEKTTETPPKKAKTTKKTGEKTKRKTTKETTEERMEKAAEETGEEVGDTTTGMLESREARIARDIEKEKKRLDAMVLEKSNSIVNAQMNEEETSCVIFSQYEEYS